MTWLRQLPQDARFAVRALRRVPGFAALVVLTLALGIGLTTAVFSVFNAVLLRPLAYPDPERLVWVTTAEPQSPAPMEIVLGPDFMDWRAQAVSFDHLVAYDLGDETMLVDGAATQERVAAVSEGFWELSGVRPLHGRVPAAGELDTVLVSAPFFETRLGGDPARLGQAVSIEGRSHTVVGVVPHGFPLQVPWPGWPGFEPRDVAAYRTVRIEAAPGRMIQLLNVIGKLKAGVSIDQARDELATIRARSARARPGFPGNDLILHVAPLARRLAGTTRPALAVVLAAVVVVLLIACANVASLLFGRAASRQKEIAIRAAVGAGRSRLITQLLIESLLLALAGGAAGLLVAHWSVSTIVSLAPYAIPRLAESSIDAGVLAFALGASLVTALVFGTGPALALGRVDLNDVLKIGARPSATPPLTPRAGMMLVAVQMALAVVLLAGAGLLIKSFWRLNAHPAGFDPARVLRMTVQFSGTQYDEEPRREAYVSELLRRVQSVPGVTAAGISTHGDTMSVAIVEGAPPRPPKEVMERSGVLINAVSEGSARALGLRVLQGRWITDADAPRNVVVNEAVVRRDFPDRDPVGRRVRLGGDDEPFATIVGVVADLKYAKLDELPQPEVYVPYASDTPGRFTALVRTSVPPGTVAAAIRTSVAGIDRALPVFDVETLEQQLAQSIAPRRFTLLLIVAFAAAALGLALIGVYGVVAYAVARRTREIGIRMALGANRRRVVGLVVRQVAGTALAGIGVGVGAGLLLTGVMRSLLFDVAPTDPQTFGIVTLGLCATTLIASLVPALRAARIDPAETLRGPGW